MYVTPARFRTLNVGSDVTGLTDLQLASSIRRGARIVESYTASSNEPQRHSFLGGTIVGEKHNWNYPTTPFELGQRRVYPFHWPLIAITSLRIYVTNTQYVGIESSEIVYQPTARYLEVVSLALTSAGLFNALIIPNVGLATPFGVIDYTYGFSFAVTDEVAYATDATNKIFQAANQFWTATAPVVKVDGVTKTVTTDYTYNATEGTVTFGTAQTGVVTVTYTHKCPPEVAEANALITAYDLGETKWRSRGLAGVTSLKIAELSLTRGPRATAENLEQTVPEACILLAGFHSYRMSAM